MWLKPAGAPPWRPSVMKVTIESFLETTVRLIIDLIHAWKAVVYMLRDWRRLPTTFMYLGAWFLLSDGKYFESLQLFYQDQRKFNTSFPYSLVLQLSVPSLLQLSFSLKLH